MKTIIQMAVVWLVCVIGIAFPTRAAEALRTDINPALLYYQALFVPVLSDKDRDYLFSQEWQGKPLDGRFEGLIETYNGAFKFLRQAAKAQVPCDWGIDLTRGPETPLPGLAKARLLAQAARLRARWHLEHGRPGDARDDLVGAQILARNVANDRIIISVLVQIAMENIIAQAVAENFFRFNSETLEQLLTGLDAAPPQATIRDCMALEQTMFSGWFEAKVRQFQAESPSDDAQVLSKVRALFARTLGEGETPDPGFKERVIAASGNSSAGLLALFEGLKPLYQECGVILGLPYEKFNAALPAFEQKLAKSPNPLVVKFFPAIHKARAREFGIEVKAAMVRAASAYRVHGKEALAKVMDPCGQGSFAFERVTVEGIDRGFMLKSRLNTRGFDEALVFLEKDGPAIYLDGEKAGQRK